MTDGHADMLWQSTAEQPAIWLMNGTTVSSADRLVDDSASRLEHGRHRRFLRHRV